MKKTIETLQTVSKVGKIISKVVFILCIVGFCGCACGIIGLAIIPDGFRIGGVTIRGIIEEKGDLSIGTCYAAMAVGMIYCAGTAVIAKMAELYFVHELDAGTPFTFDGAKELMRFGIFYFCIGIVTSAVAGIVYAVMKKVFDNVAEFNGNFSVSLITGAIIIIMSLLCRYGAEISAQSKPEE